MSALPPNSDILPRLLTREETTREEAGEKSAHRVSALAEEVVGLFDQTRAPLLRYLLSFGLPVADGEEILQDVFLALIGHLESGKPRHSIKSWLFRVAHNLALKKRQRSRRDSSSLSDFETGSFAVDPSPNPEAQLAMDRKHERLQAVLKALPEADRRCLTLRAEGLRYREIAQVLDISLGAVSQSLGRSLARIARVAER